MDSVLFKELGFTEREIRVYISLLELGESTAGPIASKSRLAHTKVYDTLERLIGKGLVTYILVSKTKRFRASDPKEILDIVDERKRRAIELVKELEMKATFAYEKQKSAIHEGFSAIKSLFNRIVRELKKGDYYYAFALKEDYNDLSAPLFFAGVHKKLQEKMVLDRAIANEKMKKEIQKNYSDNKNIQIRFTKRSMPIGLVIVKGKIIQIVWGDLPTAIEITSSQVEQQYKSFFEEQWKSASS